MTTGFFFSDLPDTLTVKDLQKALRIGRSSAYKLLKNGELPSVRIGSVYRISKAALMEFTESN